MVCEKINCQSLENIKAEGVRMLQFLRALGTEDQRIAYAVLEGMQLQKQFDAQRKEVNDKKILKGSKQNGRNTQKRN